MKPETAAKIFFLPYDISFPYTPFILYSCNTCATTAPATNELTIEAVTGTKNHIIHPSFLSLISALEYYDYGIR